ncbi:MAG: TRAP transporter small permease [Succinivibrio sp.]|nr:TRAP transporter small permease [Succinivibrio sp.]
MKLCRKDILVNLDLCCAGLALCVLVIVSFSTVVSRYIFDSPFMWSEEIQILCFMWISFLGAGVAFRYGSHVSIEVIVDLLPKAVRRYVELLIGLFVTVLLIYIWWLSIIYVAQSVELEKVTTILEIPDWVLCSSLTLGLTSMVLGNLALTISNFKTSAQTEEKKE